MLSTKTKYLKITNFPKMYKMLPQMYKMLPQMYKMLPQMYKMLPQLFYLVQNVIRFIKLQGICIIMKKYVIR